MSQVDTTTENPEQSEMIKPILHNAPEDLETAIARIMELELRLGDLHRAAEIAVAVRDFTLIEGQMPEAEQSLEKKIVVEYPHVDQKLTVITGTFDPAKAGVTITQAGAGVTITQAGTP
jgi:hypothetical protein